MFYDGTKLLSMTDLDNLKPEIYICSSNRNGGKTTWFTKYLVNKFLKNDEKFCLLYRYKYELDTIADKFFKGVQPLFFDNYEMTEKKLAKGAIVELFLNDKSCGYATSLSSANQVKKNSHLLSDVKRMMFDEFQSENNDYWSDEISRFMSIHTSIARGEGKQVRYVPIFMISNPVSILNPYFTEMGIGKRLRKDTKFLKGHGFVLEQNFNESASKANLNSRFNRAFSNSRYLDYSANSSYLNDNVAFIENLQGKNDYVCTIKFKGKDYAVRQFNEMGLMYVDESVDSSYPIRICTTTADHNINYVMLNRCDSVISNLRFLFERGCFRFKNLNCKESLIETIAYRTK